MSALDELNDRAADPEMVAAIRALVKHLVALNYQEIRVLAYVASRMAGIGRTLYGPMDVRTDPRNWVHEAADEMADMVVYLGAEFLRRDMLARKEPA